MPFFYCKINTFLNQFTKLLITCDGIVPLAWSLHHWIGFLTLFKGIPILVMSDLKMAMAIMAIIKTPTKKSSGINPKLDNPTGPSWFGHPVPFCLYLVWFPIVPDVKMSPVLKNTFKANYKKNTIRLKIKTSWSFMKTRLQFLSLFSLSLYCGPLIKPGNQFLGKRVHWIQAICPLKKPQEQSWKNLPVPLVVPENILVGWGTFGSTFYDQKLSKTCQYLPNMPKRHQNEVLCE